MPSRSRPPSLLPVRSYVGSEGLTPSSARSDGNARSQNLRRSSIGPADAVGEGPTPWALSPNVFHARYWQVLAHTEGEWRPLEGTHLALDSDPWALKGARPPSLAQAGREADEAEALAAGMDTWQPAPGTGDSALRTALKPVRCAVRRRAGLCCLKRPAAGVGAGHGSRVLGAATRRRTPAPRLGEPAGVKPGTPSPPCAGLPAGNSSCSSTSLMPSRSH